MVRHEVINLSDTEAVIVGPSKKHAGNDITIQNINTIGNIYIGNENVTNENYGYRLSPNNAISFELSGTDILYAIAENDGMKAAVLMISLEVGY